MAEHLPQMAQPSSQLFTAAGGSHQPQVLMSTLRDTAHLAAINVALALTSSATGAAGLSGDRPSIPIHPRPLPGAHSNAFISSGGHASANATAIASHITAIPVRPRPIPPLLSATKPMADLPSQLGQTNPRNVSPASSGKKAGFGLSARLLSTTTDKLPEMPSQYTTKGCFVRDQVKLGRTFDQVTSRGC